MLHIGVYQLHSNPVPHVHAFETIYQFSFDGRMENTLSVSG